VGAALLTPASLSIVLAAFPQSKRALTVSLWGAVAGFAAAVGPSLGSFVIESAGWRGPSSSTCRSARYRCGAARPC
jgi:MFS family permease